MTMMSGAQDKTKRNGPTPGGGTEFGVHVSHRLINDKNNVIDFTERRLMTYAENVTDAQQKSVVEALLNDYREGHVAVAWKRGDPVYFRIAR